MYAFFLFVAKIGAHTRTHVYMQSEIAVIYCLPHYISMTCSVYITQIFRVPSRLTAKENYPPGLAFALKCGQQDSRRRVRGNGEDMRMGIKVCGRWI